MYAGCIYIDQVEEIANQLGRKLFNAEFADVRAISGVIANLIAYTAFTEPGDHIMSISIPSGGHISYAKKKLGGTAGKVRGLKVHYFAFDEKEMNIDVDGTIKRVKKLEKQGKRIKLFIMGASVFLFPEPVKEIREIADEIGAYIHFDGAHVAGLIAGGKFQDPLREGADVFTISTHKTLPGPQGGAVFSHSKYAEILKAAAFPSTMSNHHLHLVAGNSSS